MFLVFSFYSICFLYLVPTENVCNGWTDPQEGCPEPVWYADDYCADDNNIGACNYDGGKFVFLLKWGNDMIRKVSVKQNS